jgi:hypothetical protein
MAASASTQMRGPPPGWGGFGRGAPGFGGPLGPGGLKWVALATKFVSEMSKIILWENKAFDSKKKYFGLHTRAFLQTTEFS